MSARPRGRFVCASLAGREMICLTAAREAMCCWARAATTAWPAGRYTTAAGKTEAMPARALNTALPDTATAAAANPDHSSTNTQEQGVGEADLVETDGKYIYSITGGKLSIVSALPADQITVISQTT